MMIRKTLLFLTPAIIILALAPFTRADTVADDAADIDFDRDIRPILSDTCFTCHGPDEKNRKSRLRLDTKTGLFGDRGGYHIIAPGDLDKSELYLRITSDVKRERMPPAKAHKQLKPKQIALIRDWIKTGAKWEEHWAFVAPKPPPLPKVKNTTWPANNIDWFILARLEKAGLQPSPRAAKEKLIRRVTLDLTGLPPTLAEIDAFLRDDSPRAYVKVVDRLLASPRYGEHMALAWLDAARYADTNGYQQDRTRTMWPWRDWLIEALNDNMPYDQFTIEMLAGDLLPDAKLQQKLATGFNRNHMLNGEGGRLAEESRVEYVVDRVDTTATIWLGLTMGCARCHSHKYDPISQKEFYNFYAYFNNIDEVGGVDRGGNAKPVMKLPTKEQTARQRQLRKKINQLNQQLKTTEDDQAKKKLQKQIKQAQKTLQNVERSILEVMIMHDRAKRRPTHLLVRGEWNKPDKSESLAPGTPAVLPPLPKDAVKNRLSLAKWIVAPDNPLTARVAVNRYWQHFFGAGLVKTVEDFGIQGERPSHPRLLDWLAVEFTKDWNVKALHKRIVMSATYQQSSRQTSTSKNQKSMVPYNRLLSRGPRVRLSSQAIRDQALALSGLLVEKRGGPPVKPYQPGGVWLDLSLGKTKYERDKGSSLYRRSIYTFWRRSVGPTMFFDTPARQVCAVRQSRTNTPLHALTLMNDITYIEAARVFAQRVMKEGGDAPMARLSLAFRMATSRQPDEHERAKLVEVFSKIHKRYRDDPAAAREFIRVGDAPQPPGFDAVELAAYTGMMNLILNLDEVINRE